MRTWPDWMDEAGLMAKSADQSHTGGSIQQSLAEHTFQVLERLADQVRLRPHLPDVMDDPRLWDRLYWGCLLHDFGKAASDFQQRLKPNAQHNKWSEQKHRHEALSLGFVDWLFPPGHPDRAHVIAVITCHHKDAKYILEHYNAHKVFNRKNFSPADMDMRDEFMNYLAGQISSDVRYHLWRWVKECGIAWANQLGFPLIAIPSLVEWEVAAQTDFHKTIYTVLRDFEKWQRAITPNLKATIHVYRGLILTSDHAASANARTFPDFHLTRETALRPLTGKTPKTHQQAADTSEFGSALLVAPTGSGKTESAMLWAARQMTLRPASRLFYTLPYQASMNATAIRLSEKFFGNPFDEDQQEVTLQHSRATLRFYQDRMEIEDNPKAAQRVARERQNKTGLNYFPMQVFSPYQMLKAAYSLKGYETFLVDYADALFVFDEIHAYEPERMALIIPFMRWLHRHYHARFLIMTATLPPMLDELLNAALPGLHPICADDKTFQESQRHRVVLLDGEIIDYTRQIIDHYRRGESVLVCCNTVQRAQAMYDHLAAQGVSKWLPDIQSDGDLCLLHGRFNLKDRTAKEKWLLRRVGTRQHEGINRSPIIMVATQVVEVSLDVDFDTLYTDPAPLEALLQRFGRVNRGRGADAELCNVHVCQAPIGEKESKPYDHRLVTRAIEVLPVGVINEQQVSLLLKSVYEGDLRDEWMERYTNAANEFETVILEGMEPFESADKEWEQKFYKMFEGQQVLPASCSDAYEAAFNTGGRLAASEYLVSVRNGQYWMLRNRGYAKPYDDSGQEWLWCALTPYDSEYGLRFEFPLGDDDA